VVKRFSARAASINKYVTSVLLNLLLPILILQTFMLSSLESLTELPVVIVLALAMHLLGAGVLALRFRWSSLEDRKKGALLLTVTFSNSVFLAFPLVLMFIGSVGVQIATVYAVVQMMVITTLGTAIGSAYGDSALGRREMARKALLFPPFLTSVAAILLISVGVTIPSELDALLAVNNSVTTYLSLFVVGLGLHSHITGLDLRRVIEAVMVKQAVVPLFFIVFFIIFSFSSVVEQVMIVEALMPPAVLTVVYSAGFGLDQDCAATAVTVGTFALLPVVPLLPFILS
jgi:predicted permease